MTSVRPHISVLLALLVLLAAGSLLVADSPYDPNIVSEQAPFAPERPDTLDSKTVTTYLVDYEERRLRNDLVRSRDYTLDRGDDVVAKCTSVTMNQTDTDRFRIRLRCHGEIADTYRLIQPTKFTYTVTYSVTEKTTSQLAIERFPYPQRDHMREKPWASE
ncbi:hypothetical protein ACFQJC_09680 [Haloferax namakaokahaiae]|uniref:DUF3857 domain-containing protein n=1 Tax=Haloferax namakaokahaiae TaxID=1748331 RepID=A0ABD5ZF53_9EURY